MIAQNHASKSSHIFTAVVLRQNQFYSIGPKMAFSIETLGFESNSRQNVPEYNPDFLPQFI